MLSGRVSFETAFANRYLNFDTLSAVHRTSVLNTLQGGTTLPAHRAGWRDSAVKG